MRIKYSTKYEIVVNKTVSFFPFLFVPVSFFLAKIVSFFPVSFFFCFFLSVFRERQGRIQTCGGPWVAFSSGAVEVYPTLEYMTRHTWRPPGCRGPWVAFSTGAVEVYPTLGYQNVKGDKTYVEAPWLRRTLGDCPVLNPALVKADQRTLVSVP